MKLAALKTNVAAVNEGAWVDDIPDLPGVRIKARPVSSPLYRRRQSDLYRDLPLSKRRDPVEMERIDAILICDVILIEWDGLDDAPYSKEMAQKLIPDPEYQALRDAVMYASAIVAERAAASTEVDAKN